MPRRELVGSICQPFNSGSGADDGIEFIYCIGGLQQIHEVWTCGDNRITPEVHPFARIDVRAFIGEYFGTDYLAENGRRVPMFSRKSINGSVKWLIVPSFLKNDGTPWAENILCTCRRWGVESTHEIWALESQTSGRYDGVDVPWCGSVPARPTYPPSESGKYARHCAPRP